MQNLWSDLDRSQPDDTSQGESQKREENDPASAPRRFQERDFLKRLRAWLLSQYVLAYGRSLGSSRIYQRCYWLDALSFERRQLSTPKNQPQSPPPALQLPLQIGEALQQKPYPLTLYAWLFARDSRTPPRKSPALELVLPQESTILPTSWLEAAPTLLPQIDQSSAIFLLNPFGPELFRHEDLAPFYQRTPPTELFLLIWHKQLFQHLETARREMEAGRPIGQIALTQFLRGDRWKTLLSEQSEEVRRDRLVDLLIGSMERHFLTVQRLDLPIHVGPATIEKAPCTLLFATRRPDSLAILNDSYCHYQRDLILHSGQGTLGRPGSPIAIDNSMIRR